MSYQYYDTFISSKNKAIPCCNKQSCNLCSGKQVVQVQQDDINLIDKLIKNKLQSRFEDIKQNLKIKTLEQFLDYHQRKYSYQMIFQFNCQTKDEHGQIKIFSFKLKNDGRIDWPNQTYFKCISPKEFQDIKSYVKPLQAGAEDIQQISFEIPFIKEEQYITRWRLCCNRIDEEIQFGPTIEIPIQLEKQSESYEQCNLQTLEDLKNSVNFINFNSSDEILQQNKHKKLDINELFNLLFNKQQ
ncbi:unnamed protein product [Paramecium sonneborni]|uniref:Nbr1 FW domain-containing protein n=1 Tax=Paramecium sonneborni TaxID=65129 RepID=A0A8S1Q3S7_9CILI|nr:unnamed protein product [Paramecium sonneborni]